MPKGRELTMMPTCGSTCS